jgi:hypothetical protein
MMIAPHFDPSLPALHTDNGFWQSSTADYVSLFDATAKAIKQVDPHAFVMNGGFCMVPCHPTSISSQTSCRTPTVPTGTSLLTLDACPAGIGQARRVAHHGTRQVAVEAW